MRNTYFKKACAYMLMIALVFGLIPETVKAEENSQINQVISDLTDSETEEPLEPPKVLYELEEEREENVKHFLMSDHSIQAVMYSDPIHYKEDGEWKDIDNTLSLEEADGKEDFTGYTNAEADFSVKIAEDNSQNNLVKIEKDKYKLEFNLVKDQESSDVETDSTKDKEVTNDETDLASDQEVSNDNSDVANDQQATEEESNPDKDQENTNDESNLVDDKQGKEDLSNLTNDQKISSEKSNLADDQKVAVNETNSADDQEIVNENEVLKAKIKEKENTGNQTSQMKDVINEEAFEVNTVSDSVVYEGIVDEKSTDIEYTVTSSGLKENIIINSKQDSYEYVFNMNAENLKLELK